MTAGVAPIDELGEGIASSYDAVAGIPQVPGTGGTRRKTPTGTGSTGACASLVRERRSSKPLCTTAWPIPTVLAELLPPTTSARTSRKREITIDIQATAKRILTSSVVEVRRDLEGILAEEDAVYDPNTGLIWVARRKRLAGTPRRRSVTRQSMRFG